MIKRNVIIPFDSRIRRTDNDTVVILGERSESKDSGTGYASKGQRNARIPRLRSE